MKIRRCFNCDKEFKVYGKSRENLERVFCSRECFGVYKAELMRGENHHDWDSTAVRSKECQHCGKTFYIGKKATSVFRNQKFCSKSCADKGGFRYHGTEHPNYREDARRRNRGNRHAKWAKDVISRDHATCQHCGKTDVELHAHHIKSWENNPGLRFDVDNGLTLCFQCHWKVHTVENDNGMNSVEPLTGGAEGNTEPSMGGNILEGVTTRGRAYRRWNGPCHWCGKLQSKRLSDVTGKKHIFCSYKCMGKHAAAFRKHRPTQMEIPSTAVIPSTSVPRESEDIV